MKAGLSVCEAFTKGIKKNFEGIRIFVDEQSIFKGGPPPT